VSVFGTPCIVYKLNIYEQSKWSKRDTYTSLLTVNLRSSSDSGAIHLTGRRPCNDQTSILREYDRGLSQLLHADLHWLDVVYRVRYKLTVTVHRCLHNKAPKYPTACCVAVSDIAGRQRLRSAHVASWMYRAIDEQHSAVGRSLSLDQPSGIRFQTSLEKRLKTLPGCHWKRRFSDNISVFSAIESFFTTMRYINRRFTLL